ncbi:hypothetical protein Tco_0316416 [Tanacetum coccineum]
MTDGELCLSSTCIFNIICSLLILSPYFFKFISFFISPLHFSLLLLSIIATSLYHQKTIVDKLRPKVVEEDDEEFLDFEIVFHDHHHPSLINSNGNADQLEEQASVMENPEQKPEKLFEELDRFEDSTPMLKLPAEISVSHQNIQIVDLEACSSEAANLDTTRIFRRLESIKSDLGKASAMATTTTTNSAADNLKTNEKEWKRTLACKLFEKRCSLEGGGEGMDSLWEAFEEDDNTNKISRRKMNLGKGKPNLVKISKALKGFGMKQMPGATSTDFHGNNARSLIVPTTDSRGNNVDKYCNHQAIPLEYMYLGAYDQVLHQVLNTYGDIGTIEGQGSL